MLRLLLIANGEVVTREQLRAALWPEETFGDFEHGVNTAVKKLRQALGDSVERPKFIETVPMIGYRFIAPLEWLPDARNALELQRSIPDSHATGRRRRTAAIGLTVVLVVVGAIFFAALKSGHAPGQTMLTQRRLTANPYDVPVTSGVISPDGKLLAYTDATGLLLAAGR